MILWIDAQLSPALAPWIEEKLGVTAQPIRDLGLLAANDKSIFEAARDEGAIVLTKDRDFVTMVEQLGAPPPILWVTCGNTSNARLKEIFDQTLSAALDLVRNGEPLVEISDAR